MNRLRAIDNMLYISCEIEMPGPDNSSRTIERIYRRYPKTIEVIGAIGTIVDYIIGNILIFVN